MRIMVDERSRIMERPAKKTEQVFLRLTLDDRTFWEGEAARGRRTLAAALREGLRKERHRREAQRAESEEP